MKELHIKMYSIMKEGYCELTDDMDSYLKGGKRGAFRTYLYDFGIKKEVDGSEYHIWVIRVPGATRGYIKVNKDGVICDIVFYENMCYEKNCYNRKMEEIKEKYLGYNVMVI